MSVILFKKNHVFVYFIGEQSISCSLAIQFYEEYFCNKYFYLLQVKLYLSRLKKFYLQQLRNYSNNVCSNYKSCTEVRVLRERGSNFMMYGDFASTYVLFKWPPILPAPVWKHFFFSK